MGALLLLIIMTVWIVEILLLSKVEDGSFTPTIQKLWLAAHHISSGGGTTQPIPRDGGAEELRGDPTVGPHPKVWTIGQE